MASLISNQYSIDSLKIRIPLSQVQVLNESINHSWVRLNTGTGEIDTESFKSKAHYHHSKGYTTKYLIQEVALPHQSPITYLTIGVSAKILESRYQEGITPETLPTLYSQLIDQDEVQFSYESLGKALVSDIDIKKDKEYSHGAFSTIRKKLERVSIAHKERNRGVRPFTGKDNQGLEWNHRETNSFVKAPYLKLYHKGIELQNKSKEFMQVHLSGQDFTNVVRLEATLKNQKHMNHFGIQGKTLNDIVHLPQEKYHEVVNYALHTNIEGYQMKASGMNKGYTTRQKVLLSIIAWAISRDMGITEIYDMTISQLEGSNRTKVRSEITNLYEELLKSGTIENLTEAEANEKAKIAHEVNEFLSEFLGI